MWYVPNPVSVPNSAHLLRLSYRKLLLALYRRRVWQQTKAKEAACTQLAQRLAADVDILSSSGIFGYVNYLVEKDRKFIIDTLINGT